MFRLHITKGFCSLYVFGRTLINKGEFKSTGFTLSISGPGEKTWTPHIVVTGVKDTPIIVGKRKGWTKDFVTCNERVNPEFKFVKYEDDYVAFEYCRGFCDKRFVAGETITEESWVIKNTVHIPSGSKIALASAPLYIINGVYQTPEVFVKGITQMVMMFDIPQINETEVK